MKKYLSSLMLVVILSMNITPAYAAIAVPEEYSSVNVDSNILPSNITEDIDLVQKTPRGVFFSAADLKIINEDGEIGVAGNAYMSTEIDELYITIYLDRQTSEGNWEQVDSFDFEFYAEDYPDGLTFELVAFTLTGYPTGHYYRLRGSYAAVKDGVMEGFAPVTDGILIQ